MLHKVFILFLLCNISLKSSLSFRLQQEPNNIQDHILHRLVSWNFFLHYLYSMASSLFPYGLLIKSPMSDNQLGWFLFRPNFSSSTPAVLLDLLQNQDIFSSSL